VIHFLGREKVWGMKGSMDRRLLVCTSFAACLAPTLLLRLLSDSNFPSSPSTTSPLFQNTVRHTLSLNPTFQNVRPFQSGFGKSQRNERSTRITHRLGPNCPSCFAFRSRFLDRTQLLEKEVSGRSILKSVLLPSSHDAAVKS